MLKISNKLNYVLFILLSFLLVSCSVGPDYEKPVVKNPVSDSVISGELVQKANWWEAFNDDILNGYIAEATANNTNIQVSLANIEYAESLYGKAKSAFYPSANAGLSGFTTDSTNPIFSNNSSRGFWQASWEIDIWGKTRRSAEAGSAEVDSQVYGYQGIILSVQTSVADTYFLLVAIDRKIYTTKYYINSYEESIEQNKESLAQGQGTQIDVTQIEAEYYNLKAQLVLLEQSRIQAELALMQLIGITDKLGVKPNRQYINVLPEIPQALDSKLLLRRPDVMFAENKLVAANAQIGIAEANFYPNLMLSAGSTGSLVGSALALNGNYGLLSFNVPLFTGFKNYNIKKGAEAKYKETLNYYIASVNTAFKEAFEVLQIAPKLNEYNQEILNENQSRHLSYSLYKSAYDNGTVSNFELLQVKRASFLSDISVIETHYLQQTMRTKFYKVFGGGV